MFQKNGLEAVVCVATTSPDAAARWRSASGLAVDCWDWPVAYPQILE